MKVTDYIVDYLSNLGVEFIFGYQGGMITHLVDSISKSDIKYIQCYHEQSAAFAAEGYARVSGKLGVAISTSGPGATNLVTGIANAYFDSIPVLYITGQVNSYEYKYDKKIRQMGFQETDIISIVKSISKYAKLVDNAEEIPYELEKAIDIATENRKGSVVLDIPMNIQRSEIEPEKLIHYSNEDIFSCDYVSLEKALAEFAKAKSPLVISGHGVYSSNLELELDEFINKYNLPVVTSLMGKSSIDEDSHHFIGMIGSYGHRSANWVLGNADKVLVLGSRLDLRQTGNRKSALLHNIQFIHIDIDNQELENCDLPNYIPVRFELKKFFEYIKKHNPFFPCSNEWSEYIEKVKKHYSIENEIKQLGDKKQPYEYMNFISDSSPENAIFFTDIGQNQMWAAQNLRITGKRKFFTSGGLAPMGYSIPGAIGAAFADPTKKIICIVGDGGFQIALQSLLLISQYSLNISVFVFNNQSLGMITQFQELYFNSNMAGTTSSGNYIVPKIKYIAKAYDLEYYLLKSKDDIDQVINKKGSIIEILLPELTSVVPKLEYNKDLMNMIPQLEEIDTYHKCSGSKI